MVAANWLAANGVVGTGLVASGWVLIARYAQLAAELPSEQLVGPLRARLQPLIEILVEQEAQAARKNRQRHWIVFVEAWLVT